MIRKPSNWFAYGMMLSIMILASCAAPAAPTSPQIFPTPTSFLRLDSQTTQRFLPETDGVRDHTAIPTVASLFLENRQVVEPEETRVPSPTPSSSSPVSQQEVSFLTVPIYTDGLNPNWTILRNSEIEVNLISNEAAYEGTASLALTPKDSSLLLFTVKENSTEEYKRDQILGLSFWLYSGDQIIETDEMVVTVLGSNAYPYWVSGDTSVKSIYDPVFSETRLYYLGINRSIPANTWAKVEVWMDERIYDPDYVYITGFYIKTNETVLSTYYVDNVEFIVYNPEEVGDDESSAPVATTLPGSQPGGINQTLESVIGVQVDINRDVHPISPLIYGVSTAGPEYLEALAIPLNSWGGNPSTRFNWVHGRAWNAGRDFFFKNGNYDILSGSASDIFVRDTLAAGAQVRLAVPTLGWVAKNDDLDTCSFPLPNGECSDMPDATCETPIVIADPSLANVKSTSKSIQQWMQHLFGSQGFDIRFISMDNEPELWGYTHYDVHPTCTTYQEILDKYIEYATAVREVAPLAELTGPTTNGWWHYWNSAAGIADKIRHGNQDFLPWFLTKIREREETTGVRILDVLDIHYYPQEVFNYDDDPETAALRLRSTRSLWDPNYVDESWINEKIYLLPRMKQLIDEYAPGIQLGISEWNWGGETSMSGALAIADVLGVFGREELYFAMYYGFPPEDSPGFYGFKMYTNFDGQGSRFGDTSVWTESTDYDQVSSYAALDSSTGNLHLMLVNKEPVTEGRVQVYIDGFAPAGGASLFQYSDTFPESITGRKLKIAGNSFDIMLPPYSITLIVIEPK